MNDNDLNRPTDPVELAPVAGRVNPIYLSVAAWAVAIGVGLVAGTRNVCLEGPTPHEGSLAFLLYTALGLQLVAFVCAGIRYRLDIPKSGFGLGCTILMTLGALPGAWFAYAAIYGFCIGSPS
jgi:hypothetical protein